MNPLHTFNIDPRTRILLFRDNDHEPDHAQERRKLNDGTWEAFGLVLERACPHCIDWEARSSCWGIVVPATSAIDDDIVCSLWLEFFGPLPDIAPLDPVQQIVALAADPRFASMSSAEIVARVQAIAEIGARVQAIARELTVGSIVASS